MSTSGILRSIELVKERPLCLEYLQEQSISIIIATGLFCAAILVGKGIAISFADKSELKGTIRQSQSRYRRQSQHRKRSHMLNKSDASAIAIRYFEPFWLLVLGATLLAIGTSIKRIARAEAKTLCQVANQKGRSDRQITGFCRTRRFLS